MSNPYPHLSIFTPSAVSNPTQAKPVKSVSCQASELASLARRYTQPSSRRSPCCGCPGCTCTLYLFPPTRPNRHWTFRQSLDRTLFLYFGKYAATVELRAPPLLEPRAKKGRFVVIQPANGDLYRDILLCDPTIHPRAVGAVWHTNPITRPGEHRRGRRAPFHLHGGAYVLGDDRDVGIKFVSSLPQQSSLGSAVFCSEYRPSSAPGGQRFPAALQGGVTAYSFLVHDLRIIPQDIVLSGDSAGAPRHRAAPLRQREPGCLARARGPAALESMARYDYRRRRR